jgi:PIN domain nuclease of toxin-antitoxin system
LILIDTHIVVWLGFDRNRLSEVAKAAIAGARQTGGSIGISAATLLELAGIAGRGRISLNTDLQVFLEEVEKRFSILPITARACARTVELPASFPKDPVDRIIAATALTEAIPLITADLAIRRSNAVTTIW